MSKSAWGWVSGLLFVLIIVAWLLRVNHAVNTVPPPVGQTSTSPPTKPTTSVALAFGERRYDDCVRLASAVIAERPTDVEAYKLRALAHVALRQHDKAIADYNEASRLHPGDATVLVQRGIAHGANEQTDKALADFSEALKLDTAEKPLTSAVKALALSTRAKVYESRDENDRALADYRNLLVIQIKQQMGYNQEKKGLEVARTRNCIGNILLKMKKTDDAIQEYDLAVALSEPMILPGDESIAVRVSALDGLARAHTARKEYAQAAKDYQSVIELSKKDRPAHNRLAWLLATCPDDKVRDGARAVELATKVCEWTDHKDASNLDTLAAAWAEKGDFAEAVQQQTRAVELATGDKTGFEARLKLYRDGKPYRDEHKP